MYKYSTNKLNDMYDSIQHNKARSADGTEMVENLMARQ